ncbi:murein L,D-transpeptidase YafK [Rhodoligotrophos appendicifer]|uniref:L,D-transpeptidase family protein n=1 Tax=Rhodoligotrophos appendicifer TaxID=987056 RepID=UPI00117FF6EB|nr:murein L,D-transpeptidase family protein [Rhodoligotrophos appendicifer]
MSTEPDKAMKPLSEEARALLAAKGLKPGAAMYVRIFKQESEFEVWMANGSGTYTFFKTYNVCNWSGDLGPKVKEGDRQAPEGYYVVTPAQMNPKSAYHLSFNIGYPNAFDKANDRTGTALMVHGGCRSAGCYAMTDDAVSEIFALAREAFIAGQREFPISAYPFKMTADNMAFRKTNKWYPFWANLKQGYDFFEKHQYPPVVGVQDKKYVFFDGNDSVPEAFRVSAASAQSGAPRLIQGW